MKIPPADFYRVLNPGKKIIFWFQIILKFNINSGYRIDHSTVMIELKFNPFERGRGLWKFKSS